jgi:hypothetical protein
MNLHRWNIWFLINSGFCERQISVKLMLITLQQVMIRTYADAPLPEPMTRSSL